ncbi:hypothetical protein WS89_22445 [Burkholderia sp. MSMB1072]|nr:hypothetical protein WS89_22445 [Burkholderia sp. MSMB1072]KWO47748.1 hypothetical protein WT97_06650 [Burkholderia sp. MSMB1459WGS]
MLEGTACPMENTGKLGRNAAQPMIGRIRGFAAYAGMPGAVRLRDAVEIAICGGIDDRSVRHMGCTCPRMQGLKTGLLFKDNIVRLRTFF